MMIEFSETAHPIFRASSALERRELRSKEGSKMTIHFNGSEQNSPTHSYDLFGSRWQIPTET